MSDPRTCAAALSLILLLASARAAEPIRLRVEAGDQDHRYVPVEIAFDTKEEFLSVTLVGAENGRIEPSQWVKTGQSITLRWVIDRLDKGAVKRYEVRLGLGENPRPAVAVSPDGPERLAFTSDGQPVTKYLFAPDEAWPCWYPVLDAKGRSVTRGFPIMKIPGEQTDHLHHRSLWFTHGDVNGVNFWPVGPKFGKIIHRDVASTESGLVYGEMLARWDWMAPGNQKLLESETLFRLYPLPQARLMDFEVTLTASEGPVRFGDTKEGMMAIRVASSMCEDKGGKLEDSRGRAKMSGIYAQKAEWCHYSGKVGEATVGVGLFDHPKNPRHPPRWFVRSYGLMAANPFGDRGLTGKDDVNGAFDLPKGQSATFRYRVYVHEGDAEAGRVAMHYASYANPPKVFVEK